MKINTQRQSFSLCPRILEDYRTKLNTVAKEPSSQNKSKIVAILQAVMKD